MPETTTTAAGLGMFYKELVEQGIPVDVCDSIVRDVAHSLTREGELVVKA